MKDILAVIAERREARGWTEYQLAERAGLPQSTISSWYRKNMTPSLASLDKICAAFGITLSQLFAERDDPVALTPQQKALLDHWSCLGVQQQELFLQLIQEYPSGEGKPSSYW